MPLLTPASDNTTQRRCNLKLLAVVAIGHRCCWSASLLDTVVVGRRCCWSALLLVGVVVGRRCCWSALLLVGVLGRKAETSKPLNIHSLITLFSARRLACQPTVEKKSFLKLSRHSGLRPIAIIPNSDSWATRLGGKSVAIDTTVPCLTERSNQVAIIS